MDLLSALILPVEQALAVSVAVFLAADVALIFFAVLARYVLNSPIGWSEEIARLFLACFTFLGMALAFRRGQHLAIFAFVNLLSVRLQHIVAAVRNLLIAAFSLGFAWIAVGVAIYRWDQLMLALGFSEGWSVVPMVIGLFLMAVFALLNMRDLPGRIAVAVFAVMATISALLVATLSAWLPFAQQLHPLVIIVPIYLTAMAAGLPLGFDIVFAAVGYLLIVDQIPFPSWRSACTKGSITSFSLLSRFCARRRDHGKGGNLRTPRQCRAFADRACARWSRPGDDRQHDPFLRRVRIEDRRHLGGRLVAPAADAQAWR